MTIYVAYLFIIMCIQSLCRKIYAKTSDLNTKNYPIVMVAFLGIMAIACFRDFSIGADTVNYLSALEFFKSIPHNIIMKTPAPWYIDFEPGYLFITKLAAWLKMDNRLFISLIALVIYIPMCQYIRKYSDNVFISFFVYFSFSMFSYSLSLFRQMMAISICLCSINFIFDRKAIKFFIMIILASLFHTTALCWLPLYFLYSFRIKRWHILPVSALAAGGIVFSNLLLSIILRFFPGYAGYVDRNLIGGTYSMLACLLIIVVAAFLLLSEDENIRSVDRLSIWAISIGIFIQSISYSFGLLGRIMPYYTIFLMVLVPRIYHYGCKGKEGLVFKCIISIGLLFLTLFRIKGDEYIYPYLFM